MIDLWMCISRDGRGISEQYDVVLELELQSEEKAPSLHKTFRTSDTTALYMVLVGQVVPVRRRQPVVASRAKSIVT